MSDDDFNLDDVLDQSLAEMEANAASNDNISINNAEYPNIANNDKNTANPQDDVIVQEALNAVQESINNANDAQTSNDNMKDDEMKDFFNEIFESFSKLDDNADDDSLDNALKQVMTKFFDANQLKEPVQIICSKYPGWLEKNKSTLSQKEYTNYTEQYKLYNEANILLGENKPDTSKIMDKLLKTFSYGSLPAAVMDGMMPDELKQFADQMAQFEKTVDNENENENKENDDEKVDKSNNNNDKGNGGDDDMNPDDAMKFFQGLMGMQNQQKDNVDDKNDQDFMPNLNDLPKLSDDEMKQFKDLMNQDGCNIM